MHLERALAQFVLQLEADGRSQHTIGQYRRHVRVLGRWAAEVGHGADVASFQHHDLARFLTSDHARRRPDGARKNETSTNALRTSMRVFWRYARAAGLAPSNPARLVRRGRCAQPPPRGLSEADQGRLLGALAGAHTPEERRDRALFNLMLATGIRVGSAVAIDVEDIDLDAQEIVLRVCKGGQGRHVFLPPGVLELLRELLGEWGTGPLFTSRSRRRITVRHAQRRLAWWLKRAGAARPVGCHGLRHACAMRIYTKTRDVLLVQAALGHASLASTMIYARADAPQVRAALIA